MTCFFFLKQPFLGSHEQDSKSIYYDLSLILQALAIISMSEDNSVLEEHISTTELNQVKSLPGLCDSHYRTRNVGNNPSLNRDLHTQEWQIQQVNNKLEGTTFSSKYIIKSD